LLKNGRRTRFAALFVVIAAAIAVAALTASSGRTSAIRSGTMTPAVGSASLFQNIGQPLATANGTVAFGCQTTSPPGCYGPDQIRQAYGIQPLLDHHVNGAGRTIVIIDAYGSPTIDADLAAFDTVWGLPAPPSFQVVAPFGIDPTTPDNASGWSGETSLDVEWSHAVAPNANIELVVAKSNNDADLLDATQWVSDNNAGDVVSQSYGEAEQCMDPSDLARQHKLFAKMSKQGITLFASSGDQGAGQPTCDGSAYMKAVSTPASDPYVTGVGGTDLIADGTTGDYQSESAWNESTLFGDAVAGGGGVSVIYTRPSYQSSVQHNKMRTVPDVSYNAAVYNGVIVAWQGAFYRFGGTSAGSPQWAGITALADQIVHKRLGQLNSALYQTRGSSLFFHDVTTGDNSIQDLTPYQGESLGTPIDGYSAGRGYDEVTGLGTPKAVTLAPYLAIHGLLSDNSFGSVGSSHGGGSGHHGHKRDH
jgi:subtilase family serine protease